MMDHLDDELYALLAENARSPVSDLARRLGVARTTVQARLERLEASGAVAGYTVRAGPAIRGRRLRATVLLQISPRTGPGVLARLKTIAQVEVAHTCSGRFDLTLELSCASAQELDAVLDRIGGFDGVERSESLIHLTTRIDRRAG